MVCVTHGRLNETIWGPKRENFRLQRTGQPLTTFGVDKDNPSEKPTFAPSWCNISCAYWGLLSDKKNSCSLMRTTRKHINHGFMPGTRNQRSDRFWHNKTNTDSSQFVYQPTATNKNGERPKKLSSLHSIHFQTWQSMRPDNRHRARKDVTPWNAANT